MNISIRLNHWRKYSEKIDFYYYHYQKSEKY